MAGAPVCGKPIFLNNLSFFRKAPFLDGNKARHHVTRHQQNEATKQGVETMTAKVVYAKLTNIPDSSTNRLEGERT
jgi:hypothetical protein